MAKFVTTLCGVFCFVFLTACAKDGGEQELGGPPPEIPVDTYHDPKADWSQGSKNQSFNFYAQKGLLVNANALEMSGPGFYKIMAPRKRHYGTYDLISVIKYAAQAIKKIYPDSERLQIGDMSDHNGGQLALHSSHQNGLDADIAYYRVNRWEQPPEDMGGFRESFVKNGKVTANFDIERNYTVFKILNSTTRVQRIFVDYAIKRAMCEHAMKIGEFTQVEGMLRSLRVIRLHDDHMHIRLTCPKNSPNCVAQGAPPAGSGC